MSALQAEDKFMRLLFFTDTHLRRTNPRYRVGSFGNDMLEKLNQVLFIALRENCDAIAFGGDFVDNPNVSLSLVNSAVDAFMGVDTLPVVAWAIGQHDIRGHNQATIMDSAASIAFRSLAHSPSTSSYVCEGIMTLHYQEPNSLQDKLAHLPRVNGSSPQVLVVHGMIVPEPVPWEHILIKDIVTDVPLVLSGDYHLGFKPIEHKGTWFANPGALARIAISGRNRIPQVAIVDTTLLPNNPIQYITLKVKAGDDVFDVESYVEMKDRSTHSHKYTQMLERLARSGQATWEAIFDELAGDEDIEPEVLEEARRLCAMVANV